MSPTEDEEEDSGWCYDPPLMFGAREISPVLKNKFLHAMDIRSVLRRRSIPNHVFLAAAEEELSASDLSKA